MKLGADLPLNRRLPATEGQIILFFLSLFALGLFYWKVPPITDLLPHLNQINAFWWALKHKDGIYIINWFAPNVLYYYSLLLLSLLFPLLVAGKLIWVAIVGIQMLAMLGIKKKLGTTNYQFFFACLLLFNLNLYWGFGNFLIGWSLFLWFIQDEAMGTLKRAVLTILIAWSHIFFLLPLSLWMLGQWLRKPTAERDWKQWLPLMAVTCWTLAWMAMDFVPKSKQALEYNFTIFDRLSLPWLTGCMPGALQGWVEFGVASVAILILLLPRLVEHQSSSSETHRQLFQVGILMFAIGLLCPDKGLSTVRASQRWIPLAFQLMILATPWPRVKACKKLLASAIVLVSGVLLVATGWAWVQFQTEDLDGVQATLASIPKGSRLLVLDFVQFGRNFKTRAVMHAGDLAQLTQGAIPQATFADNPAAFVRFSETRPYTPLLEWYPDRLTATDLAQADLALIGGSPDLHANLGHSPLFRPLSAQGSPSTWRVYTIVRTPN